MKCTSYLFLCGVLLLAACGTQPIPTSSAELVPTAPPPCDGPLPGSCPSATPVPTAESLERQPLLTDRGTLFVASGLCAACHTNRLDEAGTDVSTGTLWRASMMSNAARDPYWQDSVRAEVLANPGRRATSEDKGSTCHMPMARFEAVRFLGNYQTLSNQPVVIATAGAVIEEEERCLVKRETRSCELANAPSSYCKS